MVFHFIPKAEGSIHSAKSAQQLKKDIESVSLVKEKGKFYSMDYLSDYCFIVRRSDGDNYELYPLPKACGYSRNTNMPIIYAEITEENGTAGCEFRYVIKPEIGLMIVSLIVGGMFLLCGSMMLILHLLGMGEESIITIILFLLFTLFWLHQSFWGPCNRALKIIERIVTHDLEQDRREEEKLKERVREYEKAAGIDFDGFIN